MTGGLGGFGPHAGGLVLAGTVLYAALLCVFGGWLGVSVRSVARAVRGPAPDSEVALDELAPEANVGAARTSSHTVASIDADADADVDLAAVDELERKEAAHHV